MASTTLPPEWAMLERGWRLTLAADGYSPATIRSYQSAIRSLAGWLPGDVSPATLDRTHVRGWLAHLRTERTAKTAAVYFAGIKHFTAWLVSEDEADHDATAGVKYPRAQAPTTPVLASDDLKRLLAQSGGQGFVARRNAAILLVLTDGGLRLAELCGLKVADVDLERRMLYVVGKGTARRGARPRAVPVGTKTARAIERYLRARARRPYAHLEALWLSTKGDPVLGTSGVATLVRRLGDRAGIPNLHPHALRHTWASAFRAAGGSEGDLMTLGGWTSREMLDRYGAAAATDRAAESYRRLSLGDRL
jgi:site-specific recombinase XerD